MRCRNGYPGSGVSILVMKIAIISDTHNHTRNLQAALNTIQAEKIQVLIHCGDLTTIETAQWFRGYEVVYVYGNGDYASGLIRNFFIDSNPKSFGGLIFEGEIDGIRIAATHGHIPGKVETLSKSGQFDYVFFGHSHRRKDERLGFTRLINPGALGGLPKEDRSFCILETTTGEIRFIQI
jgi:uncharacterized protein